MQLIADRFAVDDRGHALDLATGARVCLRTETAGGPTEQASWAERCAWFSTFTHPSLAQLLDYGTLGETRRFEAWRAEPGWRGSTMAAEHAASRASRTLRANGRTPLQGTTIALGCCGGRPIVIPDAAAGIRIADAAGDIVEGGRDLLGIVQHPDRRLAPIAELLDVRASPWRTVAVALWTPDGGGAGGAVRMLARTARVAGYVPVSTRLVDRRTRELVRGRTLVFFATGEPHAGWRAIVDAVLDEPKPHIVIFAGGEAVRRVHTVSLERMPVEALIASVCPAAMVRKHLRAISTAARRSQGLRDRFEALVFAEARTLRAGNSEATSVAASADEPRLPGRAAEGVTTSADAAPATDLDEHDPQLGPWPAPGEVARLRRQLESARTLLATGRHQSGERAARQVMHALARRGEWTAAAESAVVLARSLTRRGRIAEADRVVCQARPWATQARDLSLLHEMAVVLGSVRIEQGRLSDAETLLETALASAVSAETEWAIELTLLLVRALYLRGRWADGWQRLAFIQADAERIPKSRARFLVARSRVALGRGRVADAVADAAHARDAARGMSDAEVCAAAFYASALAQLAAGDAAQADAAAATALEHARAAHHGMQALRTRLLRAEIARRQGSRAPAVLLVKRLGGARGAALPLTIRARVILLKELLTAPDPVDAAERRADALGLPGLSVLAPARPAGTGASTPAADHIVELLRCCQSADEDGAVLVAVCAQLRARLGATGVAFFAVDRDDIAGLVSDGARIDASTARRVAAANQLVMPHHGGERIEAGTPVRYAGKTVGVLVAIWPAVATWSPSDVAVLLSTGATAAGPALTGFIARRTVERESRSSDLLGVSRAIADVRAAIERAAGAPFPVLVEGESGSGKELVARSLHRLGVRRDRPFCTLNCAALPEDLVESELFGHARGAFTGAVGERRGVFEDAHTGTLFLDEVGELSPRAQAKLLRAIQEGEIRRVGENIHRRVDVRLVTATNRDLRAETTTGRFRSDLLYRLDVIRIALPPLRARSEDVPVLAEHFWRAATERLGSRATLSAATLSALARYDWPGNIRELQNVLASLAVRCPRRGVVSPAALPPQFGEREATAAFSLDEARRTFDRSFIRAALVRTGGHRSRAAEELGLSRQGLAKLMARLEIDDEAVASAP